jgi:hypothetical protein
MHAKKEDLPIGSEDGKSYWRTTEWGDMDVEWVFSQAGRDSTQRFKALPGGSCPIPHWGYLIKGRMRIKYRDHDEVINAGETFYLAPGHIPVMEEDTELVEFSPKGKTKEMMEILSRNAIRKQ